MAQILMMDMVDTLLHADSVEWCPIKMHKHLFVCGTYEQKKEGKLENVSDLGSSEQDIPIDEPKDPTTDKCISDSHSSSSEKTSRIGCIFLYEVSGDLKVSKLQDIQTAGILDMKWSEFPYFEDPLLGVATSIGELKIYALRESDPPAKPQLQLLASTKLNGETENDLLALSLDWSKCSDQLELVVSDSQGSISLYLLNSNQLTLKHQWKAHSYEAWITAFDRFDASLVYSGGDDHKFCLFDVRCDNQRPQVVNKVHTAGVTSLQCNPLRPSCLASGSYDEILRTWDVRNLKNPLKSLNLNGGIWRIKWDPVEGVNMATACMYNHFQIVSDTEELQVIKKYEEHQSIAYGVDFCSISPSDSNERYFVGFPNHAWNVLAFCSFYDHKLSVACFKSFDSS